MTMNQYGPWDTRDVEHMRQLGKLILAFTLRCCETSDDHCDSERAATPTSEKPTRPQTGGNKATETSGTTTTTRSTMNFGSDEMNEKPSKPESKPGPSVLPIRIQKPQIERTEVAESSRTTRSVEMKGKTGTTGTAETTRTTRSTRTTKTTEDSEEAEPSSASATVPSKNKKRQDKTHPNEREV